MIRHSLLPKRRKPSPVLPLLPSLSILFSDHTSLSSINRNSGTVYIYRKCYILQAINMEEWSKFNLWSNLASIRSQIYQSSPMNPVVSWWSRDHKGGVSGNEQNYLVTSTLQHAARISTLDCFKICAWGRASTYGGRWCRFPPNQINIIIVFEWCYGIWSGSPHLAKYHTSNGCGPRRVHVASHTWSKTCTLMAPDIRGRGSPPIRTGSTI